MESFLVHHDWEVGAQVAFNGHRQGILNNLKGVRPFCPIIDSPNKNANKTTIEKSLKGEAGY
jgi:hypothetical protein